MWPAFRNVACYTCVCCEMHMIVSRQHFCMQTTDINVYKLPIIKKKLTAFPRVGTKHFEERMQFSGLELRWHPNNSHTWIKCIYIYPTPTQSDGTKEEPEIDHCVYPRFFRKNCSRVRRKDPCLAGLIYPLDIFRPTGKLLMYFSLDFTEVWDSEGQYRWRVQHTNSLGIFVEWHCAFSMALQNRYNICIFLAKGRTIEGLHRREGERSRYSCVVDCFKLSRGALLSVTRSGK